MKYVKRILLLILIAIVLVSSFFIYNGHKMYKKVLAESPLEDKVTYIRSDVDFVSINDVPDYYIKAIIAVEDRRYREHGAIDIISIGRAIVSNIRAKDLNEGRKHNNSAGC